MFRKVLISSTSKAASDSYSNAACKKIVTNLHTYKSSRCLSNNVLNSKLRSRNRFSNVKSQNVLTLDNSITNDAGKRYYSNSSDLPSHIKVNLPALSPTMEMGTIVSWEKNEGDRLSEGDLLAEIETDKATMGFETPEEGYLAKIIIPAGEKNIPLGKLLCIIVENQEDVAAFKDFVPSAADDQAVDKKPAPKTDTPISPTPTPTPTPQVTKPTSQSTPTSAQQGTTIRSIVPPAQTSGGRIFASPLARSLAAAKGIDLSTLSGSGPNGRIIGSDLANAQTSLPGISTTGSFQDHETSAIRQTIAKRLLQSKQTIPHYYLTVEIEVDQLVKLREQMNSMLAKENIKLSINDFVIKAAALACKQVPEANSSWQETFIRQYTDVDISLAVNTDAGLITPIVFKANDLGVKEISTQVKSLASKARDGKLQPNEYQGGTFTISNLGMFGVNNFAAIINPPQSCILAVGSIEQRVLPNTDSNSAEKLKIANLLKVTLSCDHRTVDGAVGAKWLQHFTQYMNNPFTMVL